MGKRWQGVLDALVQANGIAGFDGLTVHYVRLRPDHIGGEQPLTRMSDYPISSGHVTILMSVIFQMDVKRLNRVYISDDSNLFSMLYPIS